MYAILEDAGFRYIAMEDTGKTWPLQDAKCATIMASRDLNGDIHEIVTSVLLNVSPFILKLVARYVEDSGADGFASLREVLEGQPAGGPRSPRRFAASLLRAHREGERGLVPDPRSRSVGGGATSLSSGASPDLRPETLMAIAALPRVVGIKDSPPGDRAMEEIRALQGHGLAYYTGWEHHLARGLPVDGNVVSLANLEPTLCRVVQHSMDPALQAEIARLVAEHALSSEDWYRHIKAALRSRGIIASDATVAPDRR